MTINWMGTFTAIGMRTLAPKETMVINTCSDNDTDKRGEQTRWSWSNPTNRKYRATHKNDPQTTAISLECLWQGTKILAGQKRPAQTTLEGNWRAGKGRKPQGAWDGPDRPLITNPGIARREIYLPAFVAQIHQWLEQDEQVREMVRAAALHGKVLLRDFDTGRGIDRNGPMSHAWVLATILNGNHVEFGPLDDNTTTKIREIQINAKPNPPLPQLTEEELVECERLWDEEQASCIESLKEEKREPTEQAWMDYCKWCCEEYGSGPFGY